MEKMVKNKGAFLKRKRFLIRKKFQLKYSGLILSVIFLSALVSGYTIYYNVWYHLGGKLAAVYPQGRLIEIFRFVNVRLALNMFFVSLLCAGVGIMVSHRIAGPVYRMIKFLDSLSEGNYERRIKLRKRDELKDLAEAINRLVERLDKEKKKKDLDSSPGM